MKFDGIDDGPGNRVIIEGMDGEPDRVGLPMHFVDQACVDDEKRLLARWIEASELSKGNIAVAFADGQARGTFAQYAERIDLQTYVKFEVMAYRWIQESAFGREIFQHAEIFARMSGERVNVQFVDWGKLLANSDDPKIALGAGIGATRILANAIKDAYRDFSGHWKRLQDAKAAGRVLSDSEATQRVRRGQEVRNHMRRHVIIDAKG